MSSQGERSTGQQTTGAAPASATAPAAPIDPSRARYRARRPAAQMPRMRALVRDTRVLLYEFRWVLALAALVFFGGGAAIFGFYDGGPHPGYLESLFDMEQLL